MADNNNPLNGLRFVCAGVVAVAVTLAANAAADWWLKATVFDTDAFYDGCALFLTLAIPALLGGVVAGVICPAAALQATAVAFFIFCIPGVLHPFWRIPLVSPESAHNRLIHFFLYSPLTALAAGSAGAWLTGQIKTGAIRLEDSEPVMPGGYDD